ncbi:MAG: TldD/PmbA family protein, partial [Vicinamibacteria bacterium]|nr:TldD/PmbA family protein [Vicinamibacteria bacterium]
MGDKRRSGGMTRRRFVSTGAAGVSTIALSSSLLDILVGSTRCEAAGGPAVSGVILPEDVLKRAVELLMGHGADFGDVFVERAAVDSVRSDDRKINTTTTIEKGVGIRAVKDGRTFYAYTDSFEPEKIYETARYVADAAAVGGGGGAAVITLAPLTSPLSFPITPLPSEIAVEKKIEIFRALTERAWSADPRVVQVILLMREIIRQVTIATSSGNIVCQTLGLTEVMAQTHVRDKEGALQAGFETRGAYAGRDFFIGENAFERVVDGAVAKAVKLLDAVDSPRGVFPVVFAPGANGVLFHESCGHGMEADLVFKGSNYKDQIGKQTAAKGVTLVDDGTIPAFPGSFQFDDEGTPSQRTVLIEDGIQRRFLCDVIYGKKLGLESTGSGRRESFRHPPIPRMRNTFIERGRISATDIVANTKRGIYVADVGGGGQVDVITGNFMMGVGEGHLIENG